MRITLTWLRLEVRRRWRSLAVLALLVALATATVLAAAAGARRGQSALDRLWTATLPATVTVLPNQPGFDWGKVSALPEVAAISEFPVTYGIELDCCAAASIGFPPIGDAMARTIERPVMLAGRVFNPARADEIIVTPKFSAVYDKGVGDTVTLRLASPQQIDQGYDGTTGPPRGPVIKARIVGVGRGPWLSLDADSPGQTGGVLASPALFGRYRANILGTSGLSYINALIRLKGGEAAIPAFRADLARVTGRPDIDVWNNREFFGGAIERITKYEAACLLAFALAALAAAVFLIGQSVARYTSATVADLHVLRAVGLMPRQAVASATAPPLLAAAAGAAVGVAAAIAASAWMPIGFASGVEPHPGIDADWLILGPGWLLAPALVAAGSSAAAALALTARRRRAVPRRSAVVAAATAAGLGVPVVVGARFALESGRGRTAVPVRPALLGAVAGVLGVLAAFTFSAGVSDAAANPARFGQTWQLVTFLGLSGQDFGPASQVLAAVAADPNVTGVDDARIGGVQSGQVSVESFTYQPVAGKSVPVVLTGGRMPAAADEIVLAPTTAAEMHAAVGSVVRLAGGTVPQAMTVTGIGFVPAGPHNNYDEGAWLTPAGYDRHLPRRALQLQVPPRRGVPAAGRGYPGDGPPAERGGSGGQGRAGALLRARGPAAGSRGDQGHGRAAARAERIPGRAGRRRRRARPVHRGAPPPARTGRAAGAGPDPGAGSAGHSHPGHLARGHRAGLRDPAGHRARPGSVASRRRHGPAGLPAAGGGMGHAPHRAGGPAGRQPAGRLAGPARGAAAHRGDPAHRVVRAE